MSQQDDLATIQHRLDELVQRVGQLERTVDQLRGAGDQPRGSRAERKPAENRELVTIPDVPYDNALWTDSDDEGLGVRDRRAP
ncbi:MULTISPECIES: hypothetical protein [Streptomyces]|uniref:Uncharacterized protein n=2 Tax=Streptomyces TaxID=1883 RepID=A0A646KRM0_STRJU|nr:MULTISPECIES: hypothetical protein [Streptomyces]MQS39519.1 hypothetical protein [Streptomyces katsurahamanus]MQT04501.1 hypothetical protein [Streptomyces jumonjinensis]